MIIPIIWNGEIEAWKGLYPVNGRGAPAIQQLLLQSHPSFFSGLFPLTQELQTILPSFSRQFLQGIKCSLTNPFCNLGASQLQVLSARLPGDLAACCSLAHKSQFWWQTNATEAWDGSFLVDTKMPQGHKPRCKGRG